MTNIDGKYPKSVRLTQAQIDWFEKNAIDFSIWIRKRIDEAMRGEA